MSLGQTMLLIHSACHGPFTENANLDSQSQLKMNFGCHHYTIFISSTEMTLISINEIEAKKFFNSFSENQLCDTTK